MNVSFPLSIDNQTSTTPALRLVVPSCSGGTYLIPVYLALITLFNATDWGFGLYRSMVLAATFLMVLVIVFVSERPSLEWAAGIGTTLPFCALTASLIPVFDAVLSIHTAHHVRVLDSLIVGLVATTIFLLAYKSVLRQRPIFRQVALLILLTPLIIPVVNLVSGLGVPKLLDIATTTADAGRAIWASLNPYDLYIDDKGAELVHDASFGGYKYLPTMALVYSPFVLLAGNKGILFANFALYTFIALAVFLLFRKLTGKISYFPVLLVLATPVISTESLAMGATDVAPVLLILVAFLTWNRYPLLTGLLIGLSLSMKPIPAAFAASLCCPLRKQEWRPYLQGVLLGLLPALPFLVWSRQNFINNAFVFNVIRPADSTTWRFYAPEWAGQVASVAALLTWMGISLWCLLARAGLKARLYAFILIVLGILLAAPSSHDNYAIWWTPVLAVVLAAAGAPLPVSISEDASVAGKASIRGSRPA